MRLKKVGDWIHYITEGGQPFYYNEKNGEFQWDSPLAVGGITGAPTGSGTGLKAKMSSSVLNRKPSVATTSGANTSTGDVKNKEISAVSSNQVTTEPAAEGGAEEPAQEYEWRPYKDPDSGALFWYNESTGISQWECPYDNPHADGVDYSGVNDGDGDEHEHDAEVCDNTDDLGI